MKLIVTKKITKTELSLCAHRFVFALLALMILGACATKTVVSGPDGQINIIRPDTAFSINNLPDDWVTQGRVESSSVLLSSKENVPALRVNNTDNRFVLARRIKASLLATPYMNWAWYMEPPATGNHPVQLIVGFSGGEPQSYKTENDSLFSLDKNLGLNRMFGLGLPEYRRLITVSWAESALQRGEFFYPTSRDKQRKSLRYTMRGGRENSKQWLIETVDLSLLYREAWPEDEMQKVEIAFIGIAGYGGKVEATAYFSGLRLSR